MILPERRSTFVPYTTAFRAVLLNRLIVLQCGAQLMLAKGNMCKGVGRLWRLAIQKQRRTGWISLNRERRDLLDLSECQTNFGAHSHADLDVLPNRHITLPCVPHLIA